jgi:chromosome segregation ATPase
MKLLGALICTTQELNDLRMECNMMRLEINKLSKLHEENIAMMERDKISIQDLREQNADVLGKWNQAAIDLVSARMDLNEALETLHESNTEVQSALGYIIVLLMRTEDLCG